jgi:hypothetical protein
MQDMARKSRKPPRKKVVRSETEAAFERRLLSDPRFLRRIDSARKSLRAGRGTRLEDIKF